MKPFCCLHTLLRFWRGPTGASSGHEYEPHCWNYHQRHGRDPHSGLQYHDGRRTDCVCNADVFSTRWLVFSSINCSRFCLTLIYRGMFEVHPVCNLGRFRSSFLSWWHKINFPWVWIVFISNCKHEVQTAHGFPFGTPGCILCFSSQMLPLISLSRQTFVQTFETPSTEVFQLHRALCSCPHKGWLFT